MLRRDLIGSALACAFGVSMHLDAFARGRTVRVAMVTSGTYVLYQQILKELVRALYRRGLLTCPPLNVVMDGVTGTLPLWRHFATLGTGRIQGLLDGHYDGQYNPAVMEREVAALRRRIDERHDVDLIWSFGSLAGKALRKVVQDVPVVYVGGVADMRDREMSMPENVFMAFEPEGTENSLRMFYRLCGFNRMGIPYLKRQEFSLNLPVVLPVCRSLHVPVILRPLDCSDAPDVWFNAFFAAVREMVLKDRVDAVYLPFFPATDAQHDNLVDFLAEHRVFSYSSVGEGPVRRGILLGASPEDQLDRCAFLARAIEDIVNGKKLSEIDPMQQQVPRFSINLKTASHIGWRPGFDAIASFDKTYTTYSRYSLME